MRTIGWLAAAAMSVAPVAATAQDASREIAPGVEEYSKVGLWIIMKSASNCMLGGSFQSGELFMAIYDSRLNNVRLSFSERSARSLNAGDKRKIRVVFWSNKVDDGWGDRDFEVSFTGSRIVFSADFNGDEMLKDLRDFARVGFFYKDKLVSAFDLDGTAAALVDLQKCARIQARMNPSDIFAE